MRWEDQTDGHQHSQIKKPSDKKRLEILSYLGYGLGGGRKLAYTKMGEEEHAQHND